MLFLLKNKGTNRVNLGVTNRFASSSSINSLDETLRCKLSRLSPVHPIEDGVLIFHHVTCEEELSCNVCHLIFIEQMRCPFEAI